MHTVKVIPYFMFEGDCEEALHFYQTALGGEVVVQSRYDNPNMNAPENYKNKVLHARLLIDGVIVLYGSDAFPGKPVHKTSGDISISVVFTGDLEKAKKAYDLLATGGKAGMAFAKQFWGDWHGGLTDRYGMHWNVNFEEPR
ncbi:VOC family protein [Dinghuibacter silviterrae]|uniref:PhnB protein n=1 Tax=Dinghuibacter silviterrae TaxID=1539049 RepID=A0A4R8DRA5_9BACT|nr:VOC family protein [Dinghuibacter silviterrae]TDX00356.1 PhnB protein [Dinghuibacter silviterrae]